ncbi:MAG TPA: exodeoxyribonuclease V subunit alpha [Arachnia sp.]|nr:exodeoxyribonuclease V subunit alpha [Arachnia sp.]HMT86583.1 exodeoxyribonuclease V subunit alpha [Arachnia sp.]
MKKHEVPVAARGLLRDFAEAGMIRPLDFHLARRMAQAFGEKRPPVELAFALAARELRLGSVCLDLTLASQLLPESEVDDGLSDAPAAPLAWPEAEAWVDAVRASDAVSDADGPSRPFRLVDTLLYLDRYFTDERTVAARLRHRATLPRPAVADAQLAAVAERLAAQPDADQDAAVQTALRNRTTVITGGPGTGKTTTVARILIALSADGSHPRVALAAPTGKAAGRLRGAVAEKLPPQAGLRLWDGTLHKLLGAAPRRPVPVHHRGNPLPFDAVVVDETSMVSLEHMARLLDAVADGTRLVLLGDPNQLRSVEAGAVLADIVETSSLIDGGAGDGVRRLSRNWRSDPAINELSAAILDGDAERCRAVFQAAGQVSFHSFDGALPMASGTVLPDVLGAADAVIEAARAGDGPRALAALDAHRILCAHREGPYGARVWGRAARAAIAAEFPGYGRDMYYVGQPLLITRNSEQLSNGDTAVVVRRGDALEAVVDVASGTLRLPPALLDDAADLHSMTIHKAQGSQFTTVSVVLPPLGSPLAARELLYTAVTRARQGVRVYGTWAAFAQAVATPVRRASGLGRTIVSERVF